MSESSKLAQAIEQRPRVVREFEVQGFLGLGDRAIHKVAIRVAMKGEEEKAIVCATTHVHNLAKGDAEAAREDTDLTDDAKNIDILFEVCRRCEEGDEESGKKSDKEAGYLYPAFPGPEWMRKHLTTDQVGTLLHLYGEVRRELGGLFGDITTEQVLALAAGCAATADTEMPEVLLAQANREWMAQAFVLLAVRYKELMDAVPSEDESGPGDDGDASEPDDPGVREP